MIYLYCAAILLCIACSAFFSASEMAFSSANQVRLENAAEDGDRRARTASDILGRFDDALSAILVGNNLVNIAASSLGSLVAIFAFGPNYAWVSTVVITVLVIIFGETIPKIVAQKNANRLSGAFAPALRFLMALFRPVTLLVVFLVNFITKRMKGEQSADEDSAVDELHSIIETAEDEEILDEGESELVNAAIDFSETSVQEVMTARVDIVAINIDDTPEEISEIIENSPYSRIPVFEDHKDNIIGILAVNHYLKALIDDPGADIRPLLMPVSYVYKTMKLPDVLEQLKEAKQHLAVVTDEYGGTLGVVSLEDVLEELVGEIWDETDVVEPEMKEIAEGVYEIGGDTQFSEFAELMGWDEDELDVESETVGGWCIEMMDEFPKVGDSFDFRGVRVTILEADEHRVLRIRTGTFTEREERLR